MMARKKIIGSSCSVHNWVSRWNYGQQLSKREGISGYILLHWCLHHEVEDREHKETPYVMQTGTYERVTKEAAKRNKRHRSLDISQVL